MSSLQNWIYHFFFINSIGKGDGLAMLWNEDANLEIVRCSNYYIHTRIWEIEVGSGYFLARFYRHLETGRRGESWQLLTRINFEVDRKWCLISDFNEITMQDEKLGVVHSLKSRWRAFKGTLDSSRLMDVSWKNKKYTWSNKHQDDNFTKERLDRAVVNKLWLDAFRAMDIEVLTTWNLDHHPHSAFHHG